MPVRRSYSLVAALVVAAFLASEGAQQRPPQLFIEPLSDADGTPGVALALRKLTTAGTLMYATAHPDDENNSVLALYARGQGMRVALVTATRGDGGQNEIGPELFDSLGILRTEELLAAHRWDGAEQYFTRAVDFGYSFSTEETLAKWGRQEILGDFVRMIRTIRPDVIVSLGTEGMGGGQHHQASAILTREAFRAAADPRQFPEQIRAGLRAWQAKKLYQQEGGFGGFGGFPPGGPAGRGGGRGGRGSGPPPPPEGKFAVLDTSRYDPMLGCTIGEVGSVAASMHKCQGRSALMGIGGQSGARYRLADTALASERANKDESSLFDDIETSLASLSAYAGATAPEPLRSGLSTIAARADAAGRAFESRGAAAAIPDLAAGLAAVRSLRAALASMALDEAAKYEIDFRLNPKEDQFEQAILLAHAIRIDALADDGLVVAGQRVGLVVAVTNRGADDLNVKRVTFEGFDGAQACAAGPARSHAPYRCAVSDARIPRDAKITAPYWDRPEDAGRATFEPDAPYGYPFRPTPFNVVVELDVAGTTVIHRVPAQYRYEGDPFSGEKRMELTVVPAFSVRMTPKVAVVPVVRSNAPQRPAAREIRVSVVNGARGTASGVVSLKVPPGWKSAPLTVPVAFSREDESMTVRFSLVPPAPVPPGDVTVRAEVVSAPGLPGGERFDRGYEGIEYPHTQRRHKISPAETRVKAIDVRVAPNLTVGYVMGVGDQVPPALEQLGLELELLDSDELAWGDLSKYDTIVTGVRAYERRDDLKANNHRLLKYVEEGGTVIVQYNKTEFNQAHFGPYPARVSNNRITDERAKVRVLAPDHPVFNTPNKIADAAWADWVQERGLYFLGERDPKYVDLVAMEDPFPNNAGEKRGALVEARYGKGRWIYVGLGLWRQLPAGTSGAYQLFANLLSLPKPAGR